MNRIPAHYLKYIYLITLSLIWGSSFILIKKALNGLDPIQVGAARTSIAGVMLVIIGWKSIIQIPRSKMLWIAISGFLGSFFPAFLFAYAQTEIDSAISAILNSTVPLLTLIIGSIVFSISFSRNQLLGVILGLAGAIALISTSMDANPSQNYLYAILVLIACLCYASNVNIIKRHLQNVRPLGIAAGNYLFILVPSLTLFLWDGGLSLDYGDAVILESLGYIVVLCVFGTVAAKIMFNKLVQITSPVFASSVTYLMPVVGLSWGLLDGERFTLYQLIATITIILAVVLVTRERRKKLEEKQ